MAKSKKVPQKAAQQTSHTMLVLMIILVIESFVFLGVSIWRYW